MKLLADEVSLDHLLRYKGLISCPTCYILTAFRREKGPEAPDSQAIFHESLFGADGAHENSYLADLPSLTKLVLVDYPEYFGKKEVEFICEVGAGRGSLLKVLNDIGYTAIGCEYSHKLIKNGSSIYQLPEDVFFQKNAWDLPVYLRAKSIKPTVVVMWHVLEHIENSLALLESLVDVCADRKTLIFQTPLPVPEYVFPEHLFFPSTETYHFIAERLGLSIKLLHVIPYTRYTTCVMSDKDIPEGKIYPKQQSNPGFSVIGQLIEQLDSGLQELDLVTKQQYDAIVRLKSRLLPTQSSSDKSLTLASDLSKITEAIRSILAKNEKAGLLEQQVGKLTDKNQDLQLKLLRAEAQLELLKDVLIKNHGEDSF